MVEVVAPEALQGAASRRFQRITGLDKIHVEGNALHVERLAAARGQVALEIPGAAVMRKLRGILEHVRQDGDLHLAAVAVQLGKHDLFQVLDDARIALAAHGLAFQRLHRFLQGRLQRALVLPQLLEHLGEPQVAFGQHTVFLRVLAPQRPPDVGRYLLQGHGYAERVQGFRRIAEGIERIEAEPVEAPRILHFRHHVFHQLAGIVGKLGGQRIREIEQHRPAGSREAAVKRAEIDIELGHFLELVEQLALHLAAAVDAEHNQANKEQRGRKKAARFQQVTLCHCAAVLSLACILPARNVPQVPHLRVREPNSLPRH